MANARSAMRAALVAALALAAAAEPAPLPALRGSDGGVAPAAWKAADASVAAAKAPQELTVVRVHRTSAFDEVSSAWARAMFGCVLVTLAFPVLWFNEKRQVKMWELFGRARRIARANVPCDKVDAANEACLVHIVGETSTNEQLRDEAFGVTVEGCVRLTRTVEMYQWVEHSSTTERDTWDGGKEKITTYTYSKDWKSHRVDSSGFQEAGHDNPIMPLGGAQWLANNVRCGAFRLPAELVARMCNHAPLDAKGLKATVVTSNHSFHLQQEGVPVYTTQLPGSGIPRVGDLRVTFSKVLCGPATVLAVQQGDSLEAFTYRMRVQGGKVVRPGGSSAPLLDKRGDEGLADDDDQAPAGGCCCMCCNAVGAAIEAKEEVFELAEATLTLREMMTRVQNAQDCQHQGLQLLGFFMLLLGFDFIFCFVPTLFRVIPFIGVWVQAFGNFIAQGMALLVATVCWCVTVAVAWFAMRPSKAVLLLAVASVLVALPKFLPEH